MLIRCSECGAAISDRAGSCPHCGAPVKRREFNLLLLVSPIAVCAIGILLSSVAAVYGRNALGRAWAESFATMLFCFLGAAVAVRVARWAWTSEAFSNWFRYAQVYFAGHMYYASFSRMSDSKAAITIASIVVLICIVDMLTLKISAEKVRSDVTAKIKGNAGTRRKKHHLKKYAVASEDDILDEANAICSSSCQEGDVSGEVAAGTVERKASYANVWWALIVLALTFGLAKIVHDPEASERWKNYTEYGMCKTKSGELVWDSDFVVKDSKGCPDTNKTYQKKREEYEALYGKADMPPDMQVWFLGVGIIVLMLLGPYVVRKLKMAR